MKEEKGNSDVILIVISCKFIYLRSDESLKLIIRIATEFRETIISRSKKNCSNEKTK